ncbi:hypothetical protein PHYBLDRAFT_66653 [Phycomyces blakesleeanus NRRL 1555(-)]|uniref:Uncharacterized protein n=1 Tax=Phycomyces blakesleeanus (strain ATCC 8743b / DSM 1359 / FGSC 10004 / NBRC 33097 / NRRL 1555) TaxID=763407 RepID=A0A162TSC8_PHYB8|nr:hypothetical protein PHYBLDRAFT_66653 [Phycomyces blakesleeanus NRRL 1555(-)]OAD69383.1 hypothetical protein PHYBLDRAFT_66653 [Phycomyces blakesleeanus NRRL 1555(-)]|eukprot:XP_018287423.1 hypothetical protein PHYBLDRAFT_66653 [Phycomyces blakesleeanus NRRL 1555(-)]
MPDNKSLFMRPVNGERRKFNKRSAPEKRRAREEKCLARIISDTKSQFLLVQHKKEKQFEELRFQCSSYPIITNIPTYEVSSTLCAPSSWSIISVVIQRASFDLGLIWYLQHNPLNDSNLFGFMYLEKDCKQKISCNSKLAKYLHHITMFDPKVPSKHTPKKIENLFFFLLKSRVFSLAHINDFTDLRKSLGLIYFIFLVNIHLGALFFTVMNSLSLIYFLTV